MYDKINCKQTKDNKNNYFFNNDCNYKIYYYICDMKTKSIIELDNSELESLKKYAIENNLCTKRQALVNIAIRMANKQLKQNAK